MSYNTFNAYTDDELLSIIKKVYSIAGLLDEVGLKAVGGNYNTARKLLIRLNANTSHWTGQAWNKNQQLKNIESYTRSHQRKKHLIVERGHQCEACKLHEWFGEAITLELEHIDGNNQNNDRENLKLLCPNCHSYTKTWRGRKNIFTSIHNFKTNPKAF